MKRIVRIGLAALAAASLPAWAKEVAGVQLPDTVNVDGKELKLNGAGLRTKLFFKVYAAGMYVEAPTKDGAAILAADGPRQLIQVFLRDVDKAKILETWREGFDARAKAQMPALKDRLEKFLAVFGDAKDKDKVVYTYAPGKGTTVAMNGSDKITIDGKDFADALFSGWVGAIPVDKDLRDELLGK